MWFQHGLPASLSCNAAALRIASPTITPGIAAGDVTPLNENSMIAGRPKV
jgi:hypothetical protein